MSNLISFDYAIKYLLKDKGDYEIVEGFISALLQAEGYKAVKIKALLESESNKESKHLKKSIADVIVEDEEGNNYIIEIDRAYTSLFLHKALFNTSRLIVDNLGASQDYLKIKKVFHINLLYFPFTETKSALQHGKVIFHEIDNQHPVDIHFIDRGMNMFEAHNVFPEYFIISVPVFDDVIKQELDEWLYLLKHSEIKESFKSPYMKKVAERLNIIKMTSTERAVYDRYVMDSMKDRDYLVSAEEKGRTEGREEGREEGRAEGRTEGREEGEVEGRMAEKQAIAKTMLLKNIDHHTIAEVTGLSLADIAQLQKSS